MVEILKAEQYPEYEAFAEDNRFACFTQSVNWTKVKDNWKHEVVVSRDENGAIRGGMLLLIRRILPGLTFLYSPRGPVCDVKNRPVMEELLTGARQVAKKYGAFGLKVDPAILETDEASIQALLDFGFHYKPDADEYDTVQRRWNYVLPDIEGWSPEKLLASFKQKCRYNIRLSQKHNVQCEICGKEGLDEYMRLSELTSERHNFVARSKEYLAKMLDAFGPDRMRLYLCRYEGKAISGAIACRYADRVYYIFGASDKAYGHLYANYLMQWNMINWAAEHNCFMYDFMGIAAKLDKNSPMYGVYRFKSGFNGAVYAYAGDFDLDFRPFRAGVFRFLLAGKKALGSVRHFFAGLGHRNKSTNEYAAEKASKDKKKHVSQQEAAKGEEK